MHNLLTCQKRGLYRHMWRRSKWTTSSKASAGRLWNSQYIPITIEQRLNDFLMSLCELGDRFLHSCMQLSLIESQLYCLTRANCANQASHIKSILICTEGARGLNTTEDIRETQTLLQQALSSIICSWNAKIIILIMINNFRFTQMHSKLTSWLNEIFNQLVYLLLSLTLL